MAAGQRYPKSVRLRRRSEFLRVQQRGRRVHTPHFVVLLCPRGEGPAHLGVTVSRKVGGAVLRNRVKRLVREVFRRSRVGFPAGHDVVVVAKVGAADLSLAAALSELRSISVRGRRAP